MHATRHRATLAGVLLAAMLLAELILGGDVEAGAVTAAPTCTIYRDPKAAPVAFAAAEIRDALRANGGAVALAPLEGLARGAGSARVVLSVKTDRAIPKSLRDAGGAIGRLGPQGYAIRAAGDSTWWVIGGDDVGAMYGGLRVAEIIRLEKRLSRVTGGDAEPYVERRGLKMNIPLDARTPSYSDAGEAAQKNIATVWDFAFWREYFDEMARNRYNALTLWSPHPFPSLVRVPEYPDVALDDVMRADIDWRRFQRRFRLSGTNMVTKEVLDNLVVVRKMPMAQKIEFWRRVMQHARDRGIEVYFITWNVFVWGTQGKYGITDDQRNPKTIAYLRASVRELFGTYPLLAGIGVTAGENMKSRGDTIAKERWLWQTYGLGVLDAKKTQPERDIRFIHRFWWTDVANITREFKDYPDSFDLSFKYARARLYSSVAPTHARPLLKQLPAGTRVWWNLRNDDIYNFRWGDPEYVRAFIRNLPPKAQTAGYHMGSDGYVWAREFTSKTPARPRQLEMKKHWYRFMLWGRMGYDPGLSPALLKQMLAHRYPGLPSDTLYDAWAGASKIIPLVSRFHWRNWDFQWSVEGCMSNGGSGRFKGFHGVDDFIACGTMPDSGLVSIVRYRDQVLAGRQPEAGTPLHVARELQEHARAALAKLASIEGDAPEDARPVLDDIEAMARLGNYYAEKILGATDLALARKAKDARRKDAAVAHLLKAADHWRRYATVASREHRPQLLARSGYMDFTALHEGVLKDVETARAAKVE